MLIKMYLFSVLLMSLKCDFAITTLPNLPYELKLVQPSHYVSFVLKTFNYLQSYFLCSSSYLRQNSWHDYTYLQCTCLLYHTEDSEKKKKRVDQLFTSFCITWITILGLENHLKTYAIYLQYRWHNVKMEFHSVTTLTIVYCLHTVTSYS